MKLFLFQIRTKKKRRTLDVLVHAKTKRAAEKHLDEKYLDHKRLRSHELAGVPKHFVLGEYDD
jgi:hypothetical protein